MKKLYYLTPHLLLIAFLVISTTVIRAQVFIQSNATAEAASITPDEVADVPADTKVRLTSDDLETYEGFVKFDVSTVNAQKLSNASVITSGGQHNPSGVARISPYMVDMYGCTITDWPDPFTWNSSRTMDKSTDVLASEDIQQQADGYTFEGEAVANWIKERIAAGATEVTFRFHAHEEHPFGVWLNGTYQDGMKLFIEYAEPTDDPGNYTDTIAKINFTLDSSSDESGWSNVYGSSSFPVELDNGVSIATSGGTLLPGSSGDPSDILPANVGGTYNYIAGSDHYPVDFIVSGLDPDASYQFGFFSSCESGVDGARTTFFHMRSSTGYNESELLIYDDEITYDDDLNGFKFFDVYDIENSPPDWTSPLDYENGEIYQRYEVISQPSSQKAHVSFGVWQPDANDFVRESFSAQTPINGPGSVGFSNSSPSTWWEIDEDNPVDFSDSEAFSHLGFPLWSDEKKLVTTWSSDGAWDMRALYHPLVVRASIVAVPLGETFSGWDYWLNREKEVSISPVGNTDSMLIVSAVTPNASGEIAIDMSKLVFKLGYINAMIITKKTTTSFKTIRHSNNIECYPVPVTDCLTVTGLPQYGIISVFDMLGHKVVEMPVAGKEMLVDMNHLKSGIYLIQVSDLKSSVINNYKVVKK